jgi:uncharacterized protein (TIGR00296 family)
MLSEEDGKKLVKLARQTVEDYLKNKKLVLKKIGYNQKSGVFVSIHTYPDHGLRGCIGYPYPVITLNEALQRASLSAAFEDPRFPALTEDEMDDVIFEISVLTEPELVVVKNSKEYFKKIEIGKDGLIAEHGVYKGLLLPQVPLQFKPNWNVETFLEQTCMKCGLLPDMWLDPKTKIYKFQAQIFKEKTPRGEIIQT